MTVRELIHELQHWERDGYGSAEVVSPNGKPILDTTRREGVRCGDCFAFTSAGRSDPLIVLRTK